MEASSNPKPATDAALWRSRWQRLSAFSVRAFHTYATWLVSISWRRFIVLALVLLIVVGILHDKPPFTWTMTERIDSDVPRVVLPRAARAPEAPKAPQAPKAPAAPKAPSVRIEIPKDGKTGDEGVQIDIGKDGVRVTPVRPLGSTAEQAAEAASAAQGAADEAIRAADAAASAARGIRIVVPSGATAQVIREAINAAREEIEASVREAREEARVAADDARQARRDAEQAIEELTRENVRSTTRTTRFGIGDLLMQFTVIWVLASAVLKYTYKGRIQAEVKAAQATETAESESLRRQVVEARMAAMQAQVEPHFLFNTLASIDHLIETDPARASQMQKNLIALLRASMPTMREAGAGGAPAGPRELGRELAVIRPYLEILKVRMEERLITELAVPDGLLSAEFPPMMIQTLVENAIKHGLEPKPEGGRLRVAAEIVHGKLQVTVADTGLGFGRAATAGTGVGLANIRERLQLLYGARASLTVAENQPSGTVVTVTVPYKMVEGVNA